MQTTALLESGLVTISYHQVTQDETFHLASHIYPVHLTTDRGLSQQIDYPGERC